MAYVYLDDYKKPPPGDDGGHEGKGGKGAGIRFRDPCKRQDKAMVFYKPNGKGGMEPCDEIQEVSDVEEDETDAAESCRFSPPEWQTRRKEKWPATCSACWTSG